MCVCDEGNTVELLYTEIFDELSYEDWVKKLKNRCLPMHAINGIISISNTLM